MASGSHNREKMPKNLRTQLAVAVRSIQWTYGIFWATSTSKQGELEWNEGYYNGEIKTRKTVQAMELKADKIGLQRSEQLRELYNFLLVGEADPQAKRPSAALSPEDLTDLEWYYLVCMSFVFNLSQSLPGRALESGKTIWLSNAPYADSKVFSRSLLAKSASVQTVVCFPYLGGVIEIGTTELVSEDPNLIQHVKVCFLEFSKPICYDKSSSALDKADDDKDPTCTKVDGWIETMTLESLCFPTEKIKFDQDPVKGLQEDNDEEFNMDSSDECSRGCEHHCQMEDSMIEGISGGPPQVHCWHMMDDALSNGARDSWSSGGHMSEALENRGKALKNVDQIQLRKLQDCNHSRPSSLDIEAYEDMYYKRTLQALLGDSSTFKGIPYTSNSNCKSNFVKWKKGGIPERARQRLDQSTLKKILFTVPLMHSNCISLKSQKQHEKIEFPGKLDNDDNCAGNVLSDKRRETENLQVLKSMVPSINEVDKISILTDTIEYLKELEARVEELESCMDIADSEARTRRNYPEVLEQTSDNYDTRKIYKGMKPCINKRKACDIDESDTELNRVVIKEGKPLDVKVNMEQQEVMIEMKCPYREYILPDIMDAINNMHLDAHTVQSSTVDGVFILTLKSKFRGAATAPMRMIYEALSKVSGKI